MLLISAIAPHIAEELWVELGHTAEKIQPWLEDKTIRKVIVVPGRLVNIAVS